MWLELLVVGVRPLILLVGLAYPLGVLAPVEAEVDFVEIAVELAVVGLIVVAPSVVAVVVVD